MIRGVNLEQFAQAVDRQKEVLPKELAFSSLAGWLAASLTRMPKPTKTANRWESFTAMSASKYHDRL